jgi:MFS family permease
MKEGFLFIRQDKPSLAMVALIATTTVFIFPIISVMMPLYVRNVLHLGPDSFGYLMAASAIGSVTGALFLLSIPRDKRIPLMIVFVGVVTCAVFGLSLATTFRAAIGLLIANSLGLSMNFGMANTIVQERAPDYLRGRVSAVFGLSFFGLMPIAGLVITEISDLIGMRRALMTGSILYGIVGLTVLIRILRQCREPGMSEIQGAGTPPPPVVAAV